MKHKIKDFFVKIIMVLLPLYQKLLVLRLRQKKQINVVFYASSLAMWRYQHLYEKLSVHPRFKVYVVITPTPEYSQSQREKDRKELEKYFKQKKIEYLIDEQNGEILKVRQILSPDILFYPKPYEGNIRRELDFKKFGDRLICYYPYAFWRSTDYWSYNLLFHNLAWKLFYSTELHRRDACRIANNKGRNVEVVGYPTADDFLFKEHVDLWKRQNENKKRVIWAPHFTIKPGGLLKQSNFLWMADLMLEIAEKYSDKLQFAFKPHPRLYTELCKGDVWGQEKTDEYYHKWATMPNSQIETGEFVDLFMTSDAMIHDSGSFSIEYLYTNNPVMYIADDFEEQVSKMSEFGQISARQQYVGSKKEHIIDFIEKVIIGGEDPMAVQRKEFVQAYLVPPNGKSVVENTMDILVRELC